MKKKNWLALSLSLPLLAGCAAVERIHQTQRTAEKKATAATALLKNAHRPVVQFHQDQWVNPVPLEKPHYGLPESLLHCHMVYRTVTPQDIYQFSQDVTEQCHIRTRVTPDAAALLAQGRATGSATATQRLRDVPPPVPPSVPGVLRPLASFGVAASEGAVNGQGGEPRRIADVSYQGDIGGLLDIVTARLGISWRYEEGAITFFSLQTARFDIDAGDAKYKLKNNVISGVSTLSGGDDAGSGGTGSSGGVSGQGGSTTQSDVEMGNNLYADLKATAESMLTPGVGRLSMNQTTGTVMVTDVPEVVSRIGDYLKAENQALSRQVRFEVVIYTINTDANDTLGLDWDLVFRSLSGQYGITLANHFNASTEAVTGGYSILDTATGRAGQFAGSSLLFKALSQQVTVANVRTIPLTTTNMASVSMMTGKQTTYMKNIGSTPVSNGSQVVTTQTLNPGSVTTGTNITLLPKLVKDSDRLMLSIFIDISSLKQLRKLTSKDESIEGPDLDTNAIPQRVWMKSGQTLVLSGYDQSTENVNKQGVGSANHWFFGGGLTGNKTRQSFVITVTPFIQ